MLKNKTILITGGTSTLGEALVKKSLENQAKVLFTYFSNEKKSIELQSLGAASFRSDFSKKTEIAFLIRKISESIGKLDVLINNTAIVRDRTLKNMSEAEWDEVIQVNLKAPIQLCYGLKSSTIINIVSRVGILGGFGEANYAASKNGLIEFTQLAAHEFAKEGLTVNGVNPGFMISGMTKDLPKEILEKNKKQSLFNKFSDPNKVADFICYLLSDQRRNATGQIFNCDSRPI